MQAAGAEMEKRIDWERVRRQIARGSRRYRIEQWVGFGLTLVVLSVLLVTRPPLEAVLVVLAGIVPLGAFAHLRRRFATARDAQRTDAASLDWVRSEIDQRIRERRQVLFMHVVLCAVIAVAFMFEPMPEGLILVKVWFLAILGMALADFAYGAWIDLPRLACCAPWPAFPPSCARCSRCSLLRA